MASGMIKHGQWRCSDSEWHIWSMKRAYAHAMCYTGIDDVEYTGADIDGWHDDGGVNLA